MTIVKAGAEKRTGTVTATAVRAETGPVRADQKAAAAAKLIAGSVLGGEPLAPVVVMTTW